MWGTESWEEKRSRCLVKTIFVEEDDETEENVTEQLNKAKEETQILEEDDEEVMEKVKIKDK